MFVITIRLHIEVKNKLKKKKRGIALRGNLANLHFRTICRRLQKPSRSGPYVYIYIVTFRCCFLGGLDGYE